MEDIFLSFGFRLGVWLLLTASALGVLGLYWNVRRRERQVDLAHSYRDLVRLIEQKTEEKKQLEMRVRDLDERKAQRDRWHSEEVRAREWIQSQDATLREIKEQQAKLEAIKDQYNNCQQVVSTAAQHRNELDHLKAELEQLRVDREQRNAELRETSASLVTLIKDLEHRKAQFESLTDQFHTVSEERTKIQTELRQATEEYLNVSNHLESRRSELVDLDTQLEQLKARADRFKMENPFLADHQERISQQWKSLEGQYQEAISRNRQQWQNLEDQFKRLRDQAQRSSTSLSL